MPEYVPFVQLMQADGDVAPTDEEYVPFEQFEHELEFSELHVPAMHVGHVEEAGVEYVPA